MNFMRSFIQVIVLYFAWFTYTLLSVLRKITWKEMWLGILFTLHLFTSIAFGIMNVFPVIDGIGLYGVCEELLPY